jgi:hypothetical protein
MAGAHGLLPLVMECCSSWVLGLGLNPKPYFDHVMQLTLGLGV